MTVVLPKMRFVQISIFLFLGLFLPSLVYAGPEYQNCTLNSTCTIGEFLYDDEYTPIGVGASCTLTSRTPSGEIFLNAVDLTGTADGWYSYNVGTSGLAQGLYRGQLCCTYGEEYLCLDKSFTVTTDTATSVWSYSNRTLSSFGSLVEDIWTYTDRSISSFADLVTGIWSSSIRSLTTNTLDGGGEIATSATVESVGSSTASTIMGASNIDLTVLSGNISDIGTSLASIESKIDSLSVTISTIDTNIDTLISNWQSSDSPQIVEGLNDIIQLLGQSGDACLVDSTLFANVNCVQSKWGSLTASNIYNQAVLAASTSVSIRSELNYAGKSVTAYDDLQALKSYINSLQYYIGTPTDSSSASTVFGRIAQVKQTVEDLDTAQTDLSELLDKWGSLSADSIYSKVSEVLTKVNDINTVTNVSSILTLSQSSSTDLTTLKNQVTAIRAVVDVNRIMLEKITNQPIIKIWLEEGSIIFKTLITNPSLVATQDVELKYYLPREATKDDIISIDSGLKVEYDTTESAHFVSGTFTLSPKATKLLSVQVKDVWRFSEDEINSIKTQVEELSKPLQNTSYYAQSTTLKADIISTLDKIIQSQNLEDTPENRIKNYRQATIDMQAVNQKLESLKNLVTQAGSTGTMFGFIGGVQAIAVWGLVIILIAGFVFLALYMRTLTKAELKNIGKPKDLSTFPAKKEISSQNKKAITLSIVAIISAGSTMIIVSNLLNNKASNTKGIVLSSSDTQTKTVVDPVDSTLKDYQKDQPDTDTPVSSPTSIPVEQEPTQVPPQSVGGQVHTVIISPLVLSSVNVRLEPSTNSSIVAKAEAGQEYQVVDSTTNSLDEKWLKINLEDKSGWVLASLTQDVIRSVNIISTPTPTPTISSPTATPKTDTLTVPKYDQVFVYIYPSFSSKVVTKVKDSQPVELLVETQKWAKILIPRLNVEGWVSQEFIQRANQ